MDRKSIVRRVIELRDGQDEINPVNHTNYKFNEERIDQD
jgi:hypothetical protein